MRRAFTMIEMLLAVSMVGVLTVLSMLTFQAVTHGWMISQDYMDKVQRTDYALNQVVSGLKSMYYPHDGKQDERYKFELNPEPYKGGEGDRPDNSDVIVWSKTGTALVGNTSAVGDTVHRVQLMVLEEGNNDFKDPIQKTGLYARIRRDAALEPKEGERDSPTDGYDFDNEELYQPVLIVDGVVGFNCRVMAKAEDAKSGGKNESENDKDKFEDEFKASDGNVPYKIELTFFIEKADDTFLSQTKRAPMVRIIRIPIFEQATDGKTTPTQDEKASTSGKSSGKSGGGGGAGGGGAGGGGGGGGG